eukprot:scaffold219439_cov26-Tisochrysis_lutea.AAC.2
MSALATALLASRSRAAPRAEGREGAGSAASLLGCRREREGPFASLSVPLSAAPGRSTYFIVSCDGTWNALAQLFSPQGRPPTTEGRGQPAAPRPHGPFAVEVTASALRGRG